MCVETKASSGYCYLRLIRLVVNKEKEEMTSILTKAYMVLGRFPRLYDVISYILTESNGNLHHDRFPSMGKNGNIFHISSKPEKLMNFSSFINEYGHELSFFVGSKKATYFDANATIKEMGLDPVHMAKLTMASGLLAGNETLSQLNDLHLRQVIEKAMTKKPIVISSVLDSDEKKIIMNSYGLIFNIDFTKASVHNPHGLAAAARECERRLILDYLHYRYYANVVDKFQAKIVDVGGNWNTVFNNSKDIHCCFLCEDTRDSARATDRMISFRRRESYTMDQQAMIQDIIDSKDPLGNKLFCMRDAIDCKIQAPNMMYLHSAYEMTPNDIADHMEVHGASLAIVAVMFSTKMLTQGSGYIEELKCHWERTDMGNTIDNTGVMDDSGVIRSITGESSEGGNIRFWFEGSSNPPYVHDFKKYITKFITTIAKSKSGIIYYAEVIMSICGTSFIKFTRASQLLRNVGMITHNLTHNKGKQRITYFISETDAPFSSKLHKVSVIADATFIQRIRDYASQVKDSKFQLSEVHSYALSQKYYTVINGKTIRSGEKSDKDTRIMELVMAIFIHVYKSKYEISKDLSTIINSIKEHRSIREKKFTYLFHGFCKKFLSWFDGMPSLTDKLIAALIHGPEYDVTIEDLQDNVTYKTVCDEDTINVSVESGECIYTQVYTDHTGISAEWFNSLFTGDGKQKKATPDRDPPEPNFGGEYNCELEGKGLKIPIAGDGNCFFRAVVYALQRIGKMQATDDYNTLKTLLIDIAEKPEVTHLRMKYYDNDFMNVLKTEGQWGTTTYIPYIAFHYDVNVCVHVGTLFEFYQPERPEEVKAENTIHLDYGAHHFNVFVPTKGGSVHSAIDSLKSYARARGRSNTGVSNLSKVFDRYKISEDLIKRTDLMFSTGKFLSRNDAYKKVLRDDKLSEMQKFFEPMMESCDKLDKDLKANEIKRFFEPIVANCKTYDDEMKDVMIRQALEKLNDDEMKDKNLKTQIESTVKIMHNMYATPHFVLVSGQGVPTSCSGFLIRDVLSGIHNVVQKIIRGSREFERIMDRFGNRAARKFILARDRLRDELVAFDTAFKAQLVLRNEQWLRLVEEMVREQDFLAAAKNIAKGVREADLQAYFLRIGNLEDMDLTNDWLVNMYNRKKAIIFDDLRAIFNQYLVKSSDLLVRILTTEGANEALMIELDQLTRTYDDIETKAMADFVALKEEMVQIMKEVHIDFQVVRVKVYEPCYKASEDAAVWVKKFVKKMAEKIEVHLTYDNDKKAFEEFEKYYSKDELMKLQFYQFCQKRFNKLSGGSTIIFGENYLHFDKEGAQEFARAAYVLEMKKLSIDIATTMKKTVKNKKKPNLFTKMNEDAKVELQAKYKIPDPKKEKPVEIGVSNNKLKEVQGRLESRRRIIAGYEKKEFDALAVVCKSMRIRKGEYLNQSQMKIASIFERQKDLIDKTSMVLDLCAAPGGFTVEALKTTSSVFYHTYDGHIHMDPTVPETVKRVGRQGRGDIRSDLCRKSILDELKHAKISLVMADGAAGASTENMQTNLEIIDAEVDVALSVLVVGGDLVIKMFDTFGNEGFKSLKKCMDNFEEVLVERNPHTSLLSSEKYVICRNRLAESQDVNYKLVNECMLSSMQENVDDLSVAMMIYNNRGYAEKRDWDRDSTDGSIMTEGSLAETTNHWAKCMDIYGLFNDLDTLKYIDMFEKKIRCIYAERFSMQLSIFQATLKEKKIFPDSVLYLGMDDGKLDAVSRMCVIRDKTFHSTNKCSSETHVADLLERDARDNFLNILGKDKMFMCIMGFQKYDTKDMQEMLNVYYELCYQKLVIGGSAIFLIHNFMRSGLRNAASRFNDLFDDVIVVRGKCTAPHSKTWYIMCFGKKAKEDKKNVDKKKIFIDASKKSVNDALTEFLDVLGKIEKYEIKPDRSEKDIPEGNSGGYQDSKSEQFHREMHKQNEQQKYDDYKHNKREGGSAETEFGAIVRQVKLTLDAEKANFEGNFGQVLHAKAPRSGLIISDVDVFDTANSWIAVNNAFHENMSTMRIYFGKDTGIAFVVSSNEDCENIDVLSALFRFLENNFKNGILRIVKSAKLNENVLLNSVPDFKDHQYIVYDCDTISPITRFDLLKDGDFERSYVDSSRLKSYIDEVAAQFHWEKSEKSFSTYCRNALREYCLLMRVGDMTKRNNYYRMWDHISALREPITLAYIEKTLFLAMEKDVEDYGLYDSQTNKFIKMPKDLVKYEFAFNGKDFVRLKYEKEKNGVDATWFRSVTKERFLLVGKSTVLMQDAKIYEKCEEILDQIDGFMPPKFKVVVGTPGCGKTKAIVELVASRDLDARKEVVLTPSRENAINIRKRLDRVDDIKKFTTDDSYIIRYLSQKNDGAEEILFDEAMMAPFGKVVLISLLSGCERMVLYGDPKQIPWINRNSLLTTKFQLVPTELIEFESINVSLCTPQRIVRFLNSEYEEFGGYYTTSNEKGELSVEKINTVDDVNYDRKFVYLTYKQSDKAALLKKEFPTDKVHTIHEYQGQRDENVAVVRLSSRAQDKVHLSKPHLLVGFTRTTRKFVYMTALVDDHMAKAINIMNSYSDDELKETKKSITGGFEQVQSEISTNIDHQNTVIDKPFAVPKFRHDKLAMNYRIHTFLENEYAEPPFYSHVPKRVALFDINNRKVMHKQNPKDVGQLWESERNELQRIKPGISLLQIAYDEAVVGGSLVNDAYWQYDSQHSNVELYIDYLKFDQLKDKWITKNYDNLRPRLRTACPSNRTSTLRELILNYIGRNEASAELQSSDVDKELLIQTVVDRFQKAYFNDDKERLLALYAENPVTCNSTTIAKWIQELQKRGKHVEPVSERPVGFDRDQTYSFGLKEKPKIPLKKEKLNELGTLQTISYQGDEMNAIFCPIAKELKERLKSLLKPTMKIFMDKSPEEFEKELSDTFGADILNNMSIEYDLSKFDQSLQLIALEVAIRILMLLGMNRELAEFYLKEMEVGYLQNRELGFMGRVYAQQRSGQAFTFPGNTIITMAAMCMIIDMSTVFGALFSGDDSVIFAPNEHRAREDNSARLADLFNFEGKLEQWKHYNFCSKFLLSVNGKIKFAPDFVKLLSKLGRKDLVDSRHVEDYRVSLMDLTKVMDDRDTARELSNALNERYSCNSDWSYTIAQVISIINDKQAFHNLWYRADGDIPFKGHLRPDLEI